VSVQYGSHVRTILLITVNGEGTKAWAGGIIYGWAWMTLSLFSSIEETFYVKPWFAPGGFVTVETGNPKCLFMRRDRLPTGRLLRVVLGAVRVRLRRQHPFWA
jgi:hypothetical protein